MLVVNCVFLSFLYSFFSFLVYFEYDFGFHNKYIGLIFGYCYLSHFRFLLSLTIYHFYRQTDNELYVVRVAVGPNFSQSLLHSAQNMELHTSSHPPIPNILSFRCHLKTHYFISAHLAPLAAPVIRPDFRDFDAI